MKDGTSSPIRNRRFTDNMPVGTIIDSVVNGDDFLLNFDDPQHKDDMTIRLWVPADGRSVAGSDYATITGMDTVPDLRGVFVRGLNSFCASDESAEKIGRISDAQKDPDDGRRTGQLQMFALQQHAHSFNNNLVVNSHGDGLFAPGSRGPYDTQTGKVASVDADKVRVAGETRPTNVAVYRYVKINEE